MAWRCPPRDRQGLERDAAAGDGNFAKRGDVDILKLLFLIRYVDGMAGNLENLCTLMISDVHDDKITMRRDIQQALEQAGACKTDVSRNGEIYLFLTDEEQEINNDIRRTLVDPTEIIGEIGETVFGDLYPAKIPLQEPLRFHLRPDGGQRHPRSSRSAASVCAS